MKHAPNPIYEYKSGRTTLSFVITILITGGLFVVIPLTQLTSQGFIKDPEPIKKTVPITPPPKYTPPPTPDDKKEKPEENIELKKPFEKISIRDMDYLMENPNSSGVKYVVHSFRADDFPVSELIYDPKNLDTPPKPLVQVAPPYPHDQKRLKIEGQVSVVFIVTDKGRVTHIRITSATNREFVDSVINALRRWSFEPGKVKDKAVTTRVRQSFQFTLK